MTEVRGQQGQKSRDRAEYALYEAFPIQTSSNRIS